MAENATSASAAVVKEDGAFRLEEFFPYKVRIFYRAVSQSVAEIYGNLYGLSVWEWRVLSVLGTHEPLTASDVVNRSSIDKVNASRAVTGLERAGLLVRRTDPGDRRRALLRLTPKGETIFRALIPLVQDVEGKLLEGLTEEERATLVRLMAKVRVNANAISRAAD